MIYNDSMATIIFDFDSTLITTESLEDILKPKLANTPGLEDRIREITNLGMEGRINFRESLERRLKLAAPTLAEVQGFGPQGIAGLTPGMKELVDRLHADGVEVRIVSGGLTEAIVPVGAHLGITADRVHAVSLSWDDAGQFLGVDPEDSFSISKLEGVRPLISAWSGPKIAVGDGMTDYHLYRDKLVDHFIAYTGNVCRQAVVDTGVPCATSVDELTRLIGELL